MPWGQDMRRQTDRTSLTQGGGIQSQSSTALSLFFDKFKGGNGPNDEQENSIDYTTVKPQVSPQRWIQLGYLSLLALLSDWVCFSVAAAPSTFESNFGHSAASIIDIFLFTNVATSFLVTDIVSNIGIQRTIQTAAVLMAAGCWFRSGLGFLPGQSGLVDYPFIVLGTILVGIAQPFFQCTPPLLSAMWFANNERSTSTAIALNFNQIGIATAFLVGGSMATNSVGLENYFGLIAVATSIVTVGTILQFQDKPEIPPSMSELEKRILGEKEPPFLESVQKFFNTKGFTNALAAFICSISITNVVGVSLSLWNYFSESMIYSL
jgi:FLVCR family feline leukemia virus subgroup C receptor-related protein